MDTDTLMFFEKMPGALPLYEAFAGKLHARFSGVTVRVQKTQITFSNKYNFACVSLPVRKIKGRPDVYIIVSFGLDHQVKDPRIAQAVQPYPNRWTHHVVVGSESQIDDRLMDWIGQAYVFSLIK